jgi:hypothetical protein
MGSDDRCDLADGEIRRTPNAGVVDLARQIVGAQDVHDLRWLVFGALGGRRGVVSNLVPHGSLLDRCLII